MFFNASLQGREDNKKTSDICESKDEIFIMLAACETMQLAYYQGLYAGAITVERTWRANELTLKIKGHQSQIDTENIKIASRMVADPTRNHKGI
jgi:hypothetical protein